MEQPQKDLDAVSEQYLMKLMNIMNAEDNDTVEDLSKPQIRPTVKNIYPLFAFMYGVLVLVGILMNCGMIYHITRNKFHKDPTYAFLINIAISDLVKCVIVLPITLAELLIENWIFGQFLCYFLPILQDMPIHVSVMTYLLIAGDRYRLLSNPRKPRIPAFVCAAGTWFFAVCIVMPHLIYTTYLDLEVYGKHFRGIGLCITNLFDTIDQYIKGLFVMTYIAPLAIMAYIYVKTGRELQTREGSLAFPISDATAKSSRSTTERSISNEIPRGRSPETSNRATRLPSISPSLEVYEVELDILKEKRTQKYLNTMIATFAVIISPLMILKLSKLFIVETYENMGLLDITFTLVIWLGFVSTITTPTLYVAWQMNRITKERLRANLTFCNRRAETISDVVEMTSSRVIRGVSSATKNSYDTHAETRNLSTGSVEPSAQVIRV